MKLKAIEWKVLAASYRVRSLGGVIGRKRLG